LGFCRVVDLMYWLANAHSHDRALCIVRVWVYVWVGVCVQLRPLTIVCRLHRANKTSISYLKHLIQKSRVSINMKLESIS